VVIMVGASIDDLSRQGIGAGRSKVDLARSQIGMVVRAGATNRTSAASTRSGARC